MNRPILLLFLLILAGPQVQGQSAALAALALPDSLLARANSVVLSHDLEYRVTSARSASVRDRWVIVLLNSKHGGEDLIAARYDKDTKITTFTVSGSDAFGNEFFRARKADIHDQRMDSEVSFLEDDWVRYTKVPCKSYPCTITAEVERTLTDFGVMAFPHWDPVDREQSLVAATFTAYVPTDNELHYTSNLVAEPTITTGGKDRTYRWALSNVPAQSDEPLAPQVTETLPFVRVALGTFQIDHYSGSFSNWGRFGGFMGSIMAGRDELPDRLATEVHETVAQATTRRDTVDLLYRFMQSRCRYVSVQLGIGGWQPYSAEYVEQNRYGDCKALSNYMGAMLKEVGIASYPVLIHASEEPYLAIADDFATSAFNHMILYVPSLDIYLECTSKHAPTGYLSESTLDRGVLWITPGGGQLARTPALLPSEHGHLRTVAQELRADNSVDFRLQSTYYGADQELFRGLAAYFGSQQDRLEWLHHNNYLPDVSGSDFTYTVADDEPQVGMEYATTLNNRVRKLGSRRFFALNPYPYSWVPDRQDDRQLPVNYRTTRLLVDTVRLTYPADLEIETGLLSEPLTYSHAVGEYRAEMRPVENGLLWIRTLKLQPARLPAEDYPDFRQFFVDVAKAESLQLVFRERRTK